MIHDKLSMDLGLEELSPMTYLDNITLAGKTKTQVRFFTLDFV
jgi:hypothetical protein